MSVSPSTGIKSTTGGTNSTALPALFRNMEKKNEINKYSSKTSLIKLNGLG
jgi:hypothetical protein